MSPPSDLFLGTKGPRDAPIVLVGESWGFEEANDPAHRPFIGSAGHELDRILQEAGIDPASVFFCNVFNAQPEGNDAWRFFLTNQEAKAYTNPPKIRGLYPNPFALASIHRLYTLLNSLAPKVVIAAGNYALWALTTCASVSSISTGDSATVNVPGGIASWRGSMLDSSSLCPELMGTGCRIEKILPLIHPAAILRQWTQRQVTLHDLKCRIPMALQGLWRPNPYPRISTGCDGFISVKSLLDMWLLRLDAGPLDLAHDIETSRGEITCESLATGAFDETGVAVVIPWVRPNGKGILNFWSEEEEFLLRRDLKRILLHRNSRIIGQNYGYDTQYESALFSTEPVLDFDTMLAHHLLFPGTPKGLDYLSSLYCRFHWYWKDDLKDWDTHINFEKNLEYNATDALRTSECAAALRTLIRNLNQEEQWEWEKRKAALAQEMMQRGVLIDRKRRAQLAFELMSALSERYQWLSSIIPQDSGLRGKTSKKSWYESVAQQKTLFYDLLGLKGQINRKTGRATVDFEALQELKRRNPEFSRLFDVLIDCRSINVYHNTFIQAELEPFSDRIKCSFNTTGTSTFRWSSSENAFRRGTNLQNIPIGDEE